MKTILLSLMLLSTVAQATVAKGLFNYRQDTSSTNLADTFPSVPQWTGPVTKFAVVDCFNGTGVDIEANCANTAAPSSLASNSFFIPAGLPYNSSDNVFVQEYMVNVCWFRAMGSAASSGVLTCNGYGY
jgi:hypothetical protein